MARPTMTRRERRPMEIPMTHFLVIVLLDSVKFSVTFRKDSSQTSPLRFRNQ